MESKKKRQMEGDHKRREDIESDDDDAPSETPYKVYPDGSTFERAPPEELAKRKIFKMKPRNKPAALVPTSTPVTTNGTTTTSESTSKPQEVSANPFAGFSFNTKKPAATTSPTATTESASTNPFAGFSLNTKPTTTTTSSSLFSGSVPLFGSNSNSSPTTLFGSNSNSSPTTLASNTKTTAPTTSPTTSPPTDTPESPVEDDKPWTCECCEEKNKASSNKCSMCLVDKPKKKAEKKVETKIEPTSLFGSSTPVTLGSSTPSSSLFGSSTPVSFNTSSSSSSIFSSSTPVTFGSFTPSLGSSNTTSLFGSSTATSDNKSNDKTWTCACCEEKNKESSNKCSMCLVDKPKKKDDKKEDNKANKEDNKEKNKEESESAPWICPCCEEKNESSAKNCNLCLAQRDIKKK